MSDGDDDSQFDVLEESDFSYEDDFDEFEQENMDQASPVNTDGLLDIDTIVHTDAVDYRYSTLKDFVYKEFIKVANLISLQLVSVSFDDILVMLHYCKWQREELIDNYYDNHSKLYENCGLVEDQANRNIFKDQKDFMCMICCETYPCVRTFSLVCGHEYCINCYGEYVKNEAPNGNLIRCMDILCSLTISHKTVQLLYENAKKREIIVDNTEASYTPIYQEENEEYAFNILLQSAAKAYIVGRRSNFKWCPAPDCGGLVEVLRLKSDNDDTQNFDLSDKNKFDVMNLDIASIPMVSCPNGHGFCYECQKEDHLPCPCKMVKMWIKKCNDDSETANWLHANTHACPKCFASIEKNGGCNHMTCPTCNYEFCWICLKEWAIHGTDYYKCSKFEQDVKDAIENNQKQKRKYLQRYLHYYRRFTLHESSMKGDIKTLDNVNQRMKIFMEEQLKLNKEILSWIDVQFLQDSYKALTNGRKTLKWTYCFSYYLESTNYAEVFEQLQEYLNKVVEDLSQIFEQIISKKNNSKSTEIIMREKQNIINLSSLVMKRQKTLIECASSGLKDGLLKLTET